MDSQVAALMTSQDGVIGAGQLARLDITPTEVTRWIRRGEIVRLRRGAYAAADRWANANPDARYRLTVTAVLRARGDKAVASHHSALAIHRLPLWHVNRSLVVLCADVSESRTSGGVRVMPLRALVATSEVDGLGSLVVADAVMTAASCSVEAGVVAGDSALRSRLCTLDEIHEAHRRLAPGLRGTARLRRAINLLDPAAESPGESRTRIVLTAFGLPVQSQVEVRDVAGHFVGRVDFLVAGRVVVEFDGAVKYRGDDGPDAVIAEKRREDQLRDLGYEVVRITWAELADPARIHARIRAALARGTVRRLA